jgi:hypothetical protein
LAWKNHIDVGAGVIDADYRGNVGVVLFNHSETDFVINKGGRIAQLIIERIYTPEVEEVQDIYETERGMFALWHRLLQTVMLQVKEALDQQARVQRSEELYIFYCLVCLSSCDLKTVTA